MTLKNTTNTLNSYLITQGKSQTTARIIAATVCHFCNWCQDQSVDPQHATYGEVIAYVRHIQQRGIKQRTVQMAVGHLAHYYKWLIKLGLRDTHPTEKIKIKGIQRRVLYHIIPMPELEALYEKFTGNTNYLDGSRMVYDKQAHYHNKIQKVVFGLMIWQGMDSGELARLNLSEVHLREGKVTIEATRRTNQRTLKLEAVQILDLLDYLQTVRTEYQRLNPKAPKRLFISPRGGVWGHNFMRYLITTLNSFNHTITKPQQIRASVITHWLKNHNLRQVQYMAGHRYVSSTEAYLVNDLDDLAEDITKYHPMG